MTSRSVLVGYDLVIAAPRPVSILLATEPSLAPGVVAAHRRAVSATVDYLDDRALVTVEQRGGERHREAAQWQRILAYTHGVNRHGEPHLHDHVLVGARPLGSNVVLERRSLSAHLLSADALYRASMRDELTTSLGRPAWQSFTGRDNVLDLDEGYRALWGGHFSDRGEKRHWSRDEILAQWRNDLERFEPVTTLAPPPRRTTLDEHRFRGSFEGRTRIDRASIVEAFANAAVYGVAPKTLSELVDTHYPELRDARGLESPLLSRDAARQVALVQERGPRPLDLAATQEWRQRSRERSLEYTPRSRY
jgi:hypothetical protein